MSKSTGWKRMLPNVYARYRDDLGHPPKCRGTRLVNGVIVECDRTIEVGNRYYRTGGPGKGHGHLLCSECAMDLGFPTNEGHAWSLPPTIARAFGLVRVHWLIMFLRLVLPSFPLFTFSSN